MVTPMATELKLTSRSAAAKLSAASHCDVLYY